MEPIEENEPTRGEMSQSSGSPSPVNLRICLLGDVTKDAAIVEAAQTFGVPIITSETGLELIDDYDWRTYFVLSEFEGPVYDAIHKSKQCILGPPALKHAAAMKDGLIHNARPLYNHSMRGVVTCFTGIRKKDELTRLVNLIHSMGGCIRKEMNVKITHLISTHSGGEKYQYAKTFRLTVVRPAWVYAAWERRDDMEFRATGDIFSKDHKLKAFEGQKICFFGFPAEEQQHMVDVLKSNGGVPTELDDPECSHVVMPNSGGYFPETVTNTSHSPDTETVGGQAIPIPESNLNFNFQSNPSFNSQTIPNLNSHSKLISSSLNSNQNAIIDSNPSQMDVDAEASECVDAITNRDNKENAQCVERKGSEEDDDTDEGIHFDARLVLDYAGDCKEIDDLQPHSDDNTDDDESSPLAACVTQPKVAHNTAASTPKSGKESVEETANGNESPIITDLRNPNDISPILTSPQVETTKHKLSIAQAPAMVMDVDMIEEEVEEDVEPEVELRPHALVQQLAEDESEYEQFTLDEQNELKRKRESFDSVSLVSVESFALPASTKKPKLIRAGSITRSIKRSMSFVADRTPIVKMLRPRRSSVAHDVSQSQCADESFCSIASVDTTFNESIRKPVKEKLRSIRERITRSSSKKDKYIINLPKTPEKCDQDAAGRADEGAGSVVEFKTPKAPGSRLFGALAKTSTTSTPTKSFRSTPTATKKFPTKLGEGVSLTDSSASSSSLAALANSTTSTNTLATTNTTTFIAAATTATNTTTSITSIALPLPHLQHQSHIIAAANSSVRLTEDAPTQLAMQVEEVDFQLIAPLKEAALAGVPTTPCRHLPLVAAHGRTEMVVDEHATQAKPEPRNERTHILKSDWFWYTIQNGYAAERDYLFGDYLDSIANTPNTDRRDSLPISLNKRKRKRFSQRQHFEGTPLSSGKRRSSVSDAGLLSVSGSFFDCTTSPDKLGEGVKLLNEPETSTCEPTPAKKSMRFNHFMDFYSTESNYVGILDTIVNLFKNPLEELAESSDALLNKSEIKAIFGNFIPIHEVHQSMLERLRAIHGKWTEDCSIGDIILQHRNDLIKAYPPYVNFFEQMKETLQHCDGHIPRFHAFLKINQTKPDCGRQSLQDLMIRPVQRLPSISLLLKDILKHTNKNNPDYARLEEALKAIKEVMMQINEGKRKTESRMAIFDIFNDIDGCPPHLVSSNRSYISKCEVSELSDNLSGRGDSLVLYLFSDTIEVCKKRSRGFNTAKSPSSAKSHKHVKLMSLKAIRFVIDITDSPRAFALLVRHDKEKLHSFQITDEEFDKVVYLKALCKQMAENACRTDTDKALLTRTSQELEVDISDVNLSTLSKAFKLAARTRLKVGRAFSFNKTPSKLKRAVSTMMTSPFGSTNSLTPASQLAQMRLASCTNIHEAADEESSRSSSPSMQSEVIMPPLSVQPTRKSKTSTLTSIVGRI